MNSIATFLLFLAQLPPGAAYDPAKHANPVVTYVQTRDFKTSTYRDAQETAGIQLMGLSKEIGSLQSVDVAEPSLDPSKELKLEIKATFYPVIRQTFKIADGGEVVLHSFKAPKITGANGPRPSLGFPIPRRNSKDKDKRLGPASPPEEFEIRGTIGLLFEKDGARTIAWQEDGVLYAASSALSLKAFVRVLEDLL